MTFVCAANRQIENNWEPKAKIKHIIWTDVKKLINGAYCLHDTVALDYRELLVFDKKDEESVSWSSISFYCQSLIDNKKYAHAADILRLLALYKFGGLYLDFEFSCPGPVEKESRRGFKYRELKHQKFTPSADKISVVDTDVSIGLHLHLGLLFGLNTLQQSSAMADHMSLLSVENTLMYVGRRQSVFIRKALSFISEVAKSKSIQFFAKPTRYPNSLYQKEDLHELLDFYPLHHAFIQTGCIQRWNIRLSGEVNNLSWQVTPLMGSANYIKTEPDYHRLILPYDHMGSSGYCSNIFNVPDLGVAKGLQNSWKSKQGFSHEI
ncbi:hypothetical protein DC094_00590 [Pelagibaculum spongiae]|uniref:Uncharacterized protein n=2 Tax=Pelagibaculum spongiae TaxID=2080658 RepID=A0A2V1H7T9_9GAMM|nr:hypothetical protein DC094_00590 [Pelagibaculum spongiae]